MGTDHTISRRSALKRMGLAMAGALVSSTGLLSQTSCGKKDMKRIILYFTGTGNCLYIARHLSDIEKMVAIEEKSVWINL